MTDAASTIDDVTTAQTQARLEGAPPDGTSLVARPLQLPLPGVWVFLACLALALLCNVASFRGADFIGDEASLVRDNDLLNRLPGLQTIWFGVASPSTYPLKQYAPLAQTMFFVEHSLWGDTTWPYRLVSVILHALGGLMVWRLLRSLSVPGAIVVALLFVTHPTTIDSVSWFAERRNPLAAVLALSGAFVLLRAAGVIAPSQSNMKLLPDDPARLYGMGALLLVLALFSNAAMAATAPLVVLMIAWWKHHKSDSTLAGTCIALLVAGVVMLGLSSSVEKARAGVLTPAAWNRASTDAGEFAVRTQTAGRAVLFYATKLIVPFPVAVDYIRWQTPRDVEQFRTFSKDPAMVAARKVDVAPDNLIAYTYPLAVVAILVAAWMLRDRFGRGSFLAVAAFCLLLAPSLGFIDLGWMRYSFVSNRALYLASVPLLAGVVYVADRLLAKAQDRTVTVSSAALGVAFCTIFSAVVIAPRFKNASFFWVRNALAVNSQRSWWPRYEFAWSLLHYDPSDQAAFKQAVEAVEEVRQYKPDEPGAMVLAGLLRQKAGDDVRALSAFEATMQTFPAYAPAYFEAADAFRVQADKRPTDPIPRLTALQLYRDAVDRDPLDARARVQFGRTSWEIAKRLDPNDPVVPKYVEQAATAFDEAIALRPYDVDLLVTISNTLIEMGKLAPAGFLLEQARSIAPTRGDIYEAIGDASLARKDTKGAESALTMAGTLDANAISPRLKLGAVRESQERWRDARRIYDSVLKIDPNNAEAKRRLAEVETSATTRPEAITDDAARATKP